MRKIFLMFFWLMSATQSFATTPDIPKTTTTASCADAILNTNGGNVNIEINWEPNTIPLHWYDGNTELTVPVESQSCVYGGALTPPPPPPAREGYTFRGWRVRGLPEGYTRLQYIESTGTQRIDTGIYPTLDTAIETKFVNNPIDDGYTGLTRIIIADRWSNSLYQFTITPLTRSFSKIGSLQITWTDYWKTNTLYTVRMDKDRVTVNGTITPWVGTAETFTTNLQLRMFNAIDSSARGAYVDMYYLRIFQNGTLVRNFIPVKRNSDNVVGMWDTVTKTFFTNAGSGDFIAGPVAQ